MNLIEANRIVYSLVAQHLPGLGWRVDWGNSRSAAGRCKYSSKTLQFSAPITREVGEDEFRDTVLHEIAHAMVGPGHHHNEVWRRKHLALGGTGSRAWSDPDVTAAVAKWAIMCSACSFKTHRNRLTRAVTERGRCPECRTSPLVITPNR